MRGCGRWGKTEKVIEDRRRIGKNDISCNRLFLRRGLYHIYRSLRHIKNCRLLEIICRSRDALHGNEKYG